jgi:thimet oligopeptidase
MNDFWWWQSIGNLKARAVPLLDQARELADRALAAPELHGVVEALDALARLLDHPRAVSSLLAASHPSEAVRGAALDVHRDLVTFLSERLSDPELFLKFSGEAEAVAGDDGAALCARLRETLRVHGADRTEGERVALSAMRAIISRTAALYRRHLAQGGVMVAIDDPAELTGMGTAWRAAHVTSRDGQQAIEVAAGVADSVLGACQVASTRRRVWEALNAQGWPDNGPVLERLLSARQAVAESLGCVDWATLEVSHTVAGDVARVRGFLRRVEGVARTAAERERDHLVAALDGEVLPPWDRAWAREQRSLNAPTSPLSTPAHVVGTLRALFERALGWGVRELDRASIWARGVVVWEVSDGDGVLGRVFLDLTARVGKAAACKTMRVRTGIAGAVVAEVALMASLTPGAPMSHRAVVALFHEVGHVVHHLCASRSRWIALNGLPQGRDTVEVAPHVFESWAWEPEVLTALGWSPADVQQVHDHDRSTRGARVMRQLLYSDYSLSIHQHDGLSQGLDALDAAMFERHGEGAEHAERLYAHFPHLIAYGATYFAYPWSRAVACDVLSGISGPTCAAGALRPFMEELLSPGQAHDVSAGLVRLLGRPWHVQAYLDWIDAAGG